MLISDQQFGDHPMKHAVLYLRVSTTDQTTANQERELREVAGRMGCEIVCVYKDHGISGAKGRDKRPEFDRLLRDAAQRKFDMVMAWSVDRLGRSLQDLVAFLSELHALHIDLFLHQQGLDTTTLGVSRANLVQAIATSGSKLDVPLSDTKIRENLLTHLSEQSWAHMMHTMPFNATVNGGVVDLWGYVESDTERQAIRVAAEATPGVRAVNDHMTALLP
jgi:hypothetical protein